MPLRSCRKKQSSQPLPAYVSATAKPSKYQCNSNTAGICCKNDEGHYRLKKINFWTSRPVKQCTESTGSGCKTPKHIHLWELECCENPASPRCKKATLQPVAAANASADANSVRIKLGENGKVHPSCIEFSGPPELASWTKITHQQGLGCHRDGSFVRKLGFDLKSPSSWTAKVQLAWPEDVYVDVFVYDGEVDTFCCWGTSRRENADFGYGPMQCAFQGHNEESHAALASNTKEANDVQFEIMVALHDTFGCDLTGCKDTRTGWYADCRRTHFLKDRKDPIA
mmetsp:Transcript_76564/g.135662  ORF Transcript_76564/g.135662 Transcript_76564/m.135662 type:complete len:283 (+) Transcript_76564:156-1004(+)